MKTLKLSIFIIFVTAVIVSSQNSNYTFNVKGWKNVVDSGKNVLVIEKAWVKDDSEPEIRGFGDIGIHLYKPATPLDPNEREIALCRLWGPCYEGEDDFGEQWNWDDNITVYYARFGIYAFGDTWISTNFPFVIRIIEGDDFFSSDDIMLEESVHPANLYNKTIILESSYIKIWLRIYPQWPIVINPEGPLTNVHPLLIPRSGVPINLPGLMIQDPIILETGCNASDVLTGLKINHFDSYICSITPEYRHINPDGKLSPVPSYGGIYGWEWGPQNTELCKTFIGFPISNTMWGVVVGISVWNDGTIRGIQLDFKKWLNNGLLSEEVYVSDLVGQKEGSCSYHTVCSEGWVAVGIGAKIVWGHLFAAYPTLEQDFPRYVNLLMAELPSSIDVGDKFSKKLDDKFSLFQNYPNPFNSVTEIHFILPQTDHVTLVIYDITGREVKRLFDNYLPNGNYMASWNGTNNKGNTVPSGTYLYKIITSRFMAVRKMILLK